MSARISPKDRDAVLQALRAGVVPRRGLHHIQVARENELRAFLGDVERIAEGGSSFRVLAAAYGGGKSFLLTLVRAIAAEKGLLTVHADLTPDRRLYGASGQARALYQELTRNLATKAKPDGGALPSVVEKFISSAAAEHKQSGTSVKQVIETRLASLQELVNGYDFATVIEAYWRGHSEGNEVLKADAVRWLRGEFSTLTDARKALGVREIVDDQALYDQLKLLARFATLAGYKGLMVSLDELVNLFKLAHSPSRNQNFEQILRMLNDALSGSAENIGFILGSTPEALTDTRRGLYSYQALQTRLAENSFAAKLGVTDFGGPVVRLASLTPEDVFVLLIKLRDLQGGQAAERMDDASVQAYLQWCRGRIGSASFQTPRTTIRGFLDLLAVLEVRPETPLDTLLDGLEIAPDTDESAPAEEEEDDLTGFKL